MTPTPEDLARLHREAPLTDVHVHPSLKAWLFRRNLWRHYTSGKTFNPLSSRTDFRMLEQGGVGVIWSALHLPERSLFHECLLLKLAAGIFARRLITGGQFDRILEMMDAMEREIGRKPDRVELALSAADVVRIRGEGKIAVVHTVEGAHVLEGNLANLDVLAQRGVALLTLCHFFPNGIADHVEGIPSEMFIRKLCHFDFGAGSQIPLTPFGREILRRAAELGIIVDLAHCSPAARSAIFAEMDPQRPVVATHMGVRAIFDDPYNLSDEEIREIQMRGGAVGVIFMKHWLDGEEGGNGLPVIWETLRHIRDVTGSWDHVMVGTDFDGFTDPVDDVPDSSHMPRVTAMLLDRGLSEADVKKVLGENAQRVLEAGWGS